MKLLRSAILVHAVLITSILGYATIRSHAAHPSGLHSSRRNNALFCAQTTPVLPQCTTCNATFSSRNALFRHIRFDCEDAEPIPLRRSVALFFGYHGLDPHQAGQILLDAFPHKDLLGSTQSSIAKQRHAFVQQEDDCPSGMDTLIVNYLAVAEEKNLAMTTAANLKESLNHLDTKGTVCLHGVKQLPTDWYLHAEQSCTQHVYHFMVPASWFPDESEIVEWYHSMLLAGNHSYTTLTSVKLFKNILRSVESARTTTRQVERFRALAHKAKRPWHNYADPNLRASPNHDVTKRIVDRARFIDFVEHDGALYIVYEFGGDAFLRQQVRRIVGAAIGVVNKWLPDDFMETSLRQDVVETPMAPAGYLYRAGSRFHFAEMYLGGKQLFDSNDTDRAGGDHVAWIRNKLLADMNLAASKEWLDNYRDTVAPRICAAMEHSKIPISALTTDLTEAPVAYTRVLELLRDIIERNAWPPTSTARANVMGSLEDATRAGSFTVVDEVNFDVSQTKVPRANTMFPELTAAVFELQGSINLTGTSSSHCAVNCNAQFTPHVDSGRGAGQSLSTIVGLGEYGAGELVVEGQMHDIRYKPLQFDGWKLRHWTQPFVGERFSLVWFTPEGIERRDSVQDYSPPGIV